MKVHSVHRTYRNVRKGAPMLFLRRLNAGLGFRLEDSFKRIPPFPSLPFLSLFFRLLACGTRYYAVSELHLCRYAASVKDPWKISSVVLLSPSSIFLLRILSMTRCLNKFRQIILFLIRNQCWRGEFKKWCGELKLKFIHVVNKF